MHRRPFLRNLAASALSTGLLKFDPELTQEIARQSKLRQGQGATEIASDESFWYYVQQAYEQSPHFINLESGYFSPQPQSTLNAHIERQRDINRQPAFYYRGDLAKDYEELKNLVADFAGCGADEMVICRNTTEALNNVIMGIPMEKGDEAIISNLDYPSMIEAFEQRAEREGIKLKRVQIPLIPKNDEELVKVFEEAIGRKTKVILATHLINWNGTVLPVKKIADMAHKKGVEVISDSAHAFAHLDFKIKDLNCDYMGTSLHKWLSCPLGTGLLYVKKEHIEKTWPLFGDSKVDKDSIKKFEHIGTQPIHVPLTIANAIRFHNGIGGARKMERLNYLKEYWVDKVKDIDRVKINTPIGNGLSCAIGNLGMDGMEAPEIAKFLYDKHKIFTVAIKYDVVNGTRITPNLFTRLEDLDRLAEAVHEMSKA